MSLEQANKTRVDEELLKSDGSASEIRYHENKLFNGFAVCERYQDGTIMYEEEYVKGKPVGWTYEYYPNGQLKSRLLRFYQTDWEYQDYEENGNETASARVTTMSTINEDCAHYGVDYYYS